MRFDFTGAATLATVHRHQTALLYVEFLPLIDFPFVEAAGAEITAGVFIGKFAFLEKQ